MKPALLLKHLLARMGIESARMFSGDIAKIQLQLGGYGAISLSADFIQWHVTVNPQTGIGRADGLTHASNENQDGVVIKAL
jgi:hypothetical protein